VRAAPEPSWLKAEDHDKLLKAFSDPRRIQQSPSRCP
jgi:hypothetical protein